jgi:ABC-2 type transport system ATP-binding protein
VDHIDLDIPSGRIYGFLGPNGSGKSTTLRMLCGMLLPSRWPRRGVRLSVVKDAEAIRRRLGYMPQKFSLWEDLTTDENLSSWRICTGSRERGGAHRRAARHLQSRGPAHAARGTDERRPEAAAWRSPPPRCIRPELLLLDEPPARSIRRAAATSGKRLFQLAEAAHDPRVDSLHG